MSIGPIRFDADFALHRMVRTAERHGMQKGRDFDEQLNALPAEAQAEVRAALSEYLRLELEERRARQRAL